MVTATTVILATATTVILATAITVRALLVRLTPFTAVATARATHLIGPHRSRNLATAILYTATLGQRILKIYI